MFTHHIILTVLSIFGFILSFIVIFWIWKEKKLTKSHSTKFLLSLLTSDAFSSLVFIGLNIFVMYSYHGFNSSDKIWFRIFWIYLWLVTSFFILTALMMVAISVERFIAVLYPFFYINKIKVAHIYIVIASVWLLSIAYGFSGIVVAVFEREEGYVLSSYGWIVIIIVAYISLAASNTVLFIIAKKQIRLIAATKNKDDHKNKTKRQEIKAARICFGVVLTFMVCYVPKLIDAIKQLVTGRRETNQLHSLFIQYGFILKTISDPIVYVIMNKDMKRKLIDIILRKNN